jgi:FkbM family methyltransferase
MAACLNVDEAADRDRSVTELVRTFSNLQQVIKPTTFIEVGAFEAEFSRAMKAHGPDARVVAFEAHPDNHARFSAQHRFHDAGIEYLNRVVSDRVGIETFKALRPGAGEPHEISKRGSLAARTSSDVSYDEHSVQSVTLREIIHPGETVSLWIDVEGAQEKIIDRRRQCPWPGRVHLHRGRGDELSGRAVAVR